jgi:hypothetical protein
MLKLRGRRVKVPTHNRVMICVFSQRLDSPTVRSGPPPRTHPALDLMAAPWPAGLGGSGTGASRPPRSAPASLTRRGRQARLGWEINFERDYSTGTSGGSAKTAQPIVKTIPAKTATGTKTATGIIPIMITSASAQGFAPQR